MAHAPQFTTSRASQPWWYAALTRVTSVLPTGGFDADAWISETVDKVGEEPEPAVREAFIALVEAIEAEADVGLVGRSAAKQDCERKLSEHLKARAVVREGKLEAPQDMPDPIYVLGWMRSGTTALHRLLAADPDHWWPRHYETMFCVPPEGEDDRALRTQAVLDELARVSPHYQAIHPMQPQNPEECVNLFTHAFRTPQFGVQYRVPSYLRWLAAQDPDIAYGHYVQELGILRYHRGGGTRMVLKDPTHMGFLPSLVRLFPGARFVFIHRDPVEVFSSMSSLHAYTRAIFGSDVDPKRLGPELFDAPLLDAHADALAFCDALEPGRVAHVRHDDLRREPLAQMRAVYEALGLAWTPELDASLRAQVDRPGPRHRHEHEPRAFGLEPDAVRSRLRGYVERFDL